MNNVSKLIDRRLNALIFGMIIYYQIVLNSGWNYLDTISLFKFIGYALYLIALVQCSVRMWRCSLSVKQFCAIGAYALLMVLFLAQGNLSVASVFVMGMLALFLTVDDVMDAFLWAIVLGMVTAFGLTLIGVLPVYNTDINFWVFGFKNPNNVGYYLTVIFGLLLVKQWRRPTWALAIYFVTITMIDWFWVEDRTAVLVSMVLVALRMISAILPRFFEWRWSRFLITASPFLLTVLTVVIGKLYGVLDIISALSKVFTSRPAIWHFYMQNFSPKLFGSNIHGEITAFRGAFDGVFLYYPMTNGIIVTLLFLSLISGLLYFLLKAKRYDVVCFILGLLLFSFSENAPFFIYSSPLLELAFLVATPGMPHQSDEPALTGFEGLEETI